MELKNIVILLLFALSISVNAQSWIAINTELGEQPPIIEIIESNNLHCKLRVKIPGFYKTIIEYLDTTYASLEFEDYHTLTDIGKPCLPMIAQMIGLPASCTGWDIVLMDSIWSNIGIEKIYPYQTPLLESEESTSFDIISSIYTADSYTPQYVEASNIMYYKGMKNVTLKICPFRYQPLKNSLSIMKEFVVDIKFNSSDNDYSDVLSLTTRDVGEFINNSSATLLQTYATSNIHNDTKSLETEDYYNYLIVGSDTALLNSHVLSDFCKWKAFKGNKCKIVNTSIIGRTNTAIKDYIKSQYNQGVEYVLFIGDKNAIPVYRNTMYNLGYGFYVAGDYWYGCLDGEDDYQAEVAVGRFSTNSLEELSNMINKIIAYESKPSDSGWQNKVLMVAHKQNAPKMYQKCLEEICAAEYIEPFSYIKAYGSADSLGGNNATNSDVINTINYGVGIVNYRGHGTETAWRVDWSVNKKAFKKAQVDSLVNTDYPIVLSIACSNANIDTEECLLESFTRSENGAVAMLGAFYASYSGTNDSFNKYLYDGLFNNGIYRIGNLSNWAHMKNLTEHGYDFWSKYSTLIYLWGGDPSLEVWTGAIQCFSNNIDIDFVDGDICIETKNIIDYTIRIVSENGILQDEYKATSANYSLVAPNEPSYIVLDKHNYKPYVFYYNPTTSYIQNVVFEQDAYCRGNNIVIGNNVDSTQIQGNVIVKQATLTIDGVGKTIIQNGFKCEKGAKLIIK